VTEGGPGTAAPAAAVPDRGRLRAIAKIAIFDLGGPLAAYSLLRSAGVSTVTALVLSGVLPGCGVLIDASRRRRLDVIGLLVLAGILLGTVLGVTSHNARLVLLEGSVPTALFGVACLGSLWTRRPLMFRFALEFMGPDTPKGTAFADLWQYQEFRHTFRVITTIWAAGYLIEAGLRVVIVQNTSTATALTTSKVLPYVWGAVLGAWTAFYGSRQRRKGERIAAAAALSRSSSPHP
jgi:hypothetical protein